jgi:probable metal-binding protein
MSVHNSTEVHGHEVIAMMMTSDVPFTRASLVATIQAKFGANTRFYTCSASNMSADELVTFLEQRGKFTPQGAGFNVDPARVCQH